MWFWIAGVFCDVFGCLTTLLWVMLFSMMDRTMLSVIDDDWVGCDDVGGRMVQGVADGRGRKEWLDG